MIVVRWYCSCSCSCARVVVFADGGDVNGGFGGWGGWVVG